MNTLTMAVGSGLGDRVRAILWGYKVARDLHMKLAIVWEQDETCQVWFDDLFQLRPGIPVARETTLHKHWIGWQHDSEAIPWIVAQGESINDQCMVIVAPHFTYAEMDDVFVPRMEFLEKAKEFSQQNNLKKRVGVHIRAGHHYRPEAPSLDKFVQGIKAVSGGMDAGVCLATPDPDYCEKLPEKLAGISLVQYPVRAHDFSKEAILDALVVLYSMRDVGAFVGSRYSGFTGMITRSPRVDHPSNKISLWRKDGPDFVPAGVV